MNEMNGDAKQECAINNSNSAAGEWRAIGADL